MKHAFYDAIFVGFSDCMVCSQPTSIKSSFVKNHNNNYLFIVFDRNIQKCPHIVFVESFYITKYLVATFSNACIFLPKSLLSTDHFFEIVVLIKTRQKQKIPIVLVGKDYWHAAGGLLQADMEFYEKHGEHRSPLFEIVDDAEMAFSIIDMSIKDQK
jgi:predicted Rossmann-fold nucleotide-binding protein